jgi:hypothetical protein
MHGNIQAAAIVASKVPVRTGEDLRPNGQSNDDQSDSEGKWFVTLTKQLLSKDAGFALHLATGFEERTCYRYASGERKPPGYFVRELLRSDQGWQWLCGLMDGSDAEWWQEIVRAKRKSDAYDAA